MKLPMKTPAISRRGWVTYDGDCRFCVALAARLRPLLASRGFELIPLQSEWAAERFRLSPAELLMEMRVLESDGKVLGGAEAAVHLATLFWWAAPLRLFAQLPYGMRLLQAGYRWIAERRSCAHGVCRLTLTFICLSMIYGWAALAPIS